MPTLRHSRTSLVVLPFLVSIATAACPYKECVCDSGTIECGNLGLKNVPRVDVNSSTEFSTLILAMNSISTIPAGSLPPNLVSLSLASNPITSIDALAFQDSASTLTGLVFAFANFSRIPDSLLQLETLSTFTISDTNIQDWNEAVMKHIGTTLNFLYLDNVGLSTWPSWLQYFHTLFELTIGHSFFTDIPNGGLDSMSNTLTSLTLDNNRLTLVPKALASLTSIQILSMARNSISDTSFLPPSRTLRTLVLGNNNISNADQLSSSLQPYANSLQEFSLNNNRLTSIPDLYFLGQISTLDFSYNHITDIDSGSVPASLNDFNLANNFLPAVPRLMSSLQLVQEIVLSWNSISSLKASDFAQSITEADLQHNQLQELTADSFPDHAQIISLELSFNPISRISADAFSGLTQLAQLYLSNTRLTRLPLALTSLTNLRLLDISDNVGLVCTCMGRDLSFWASSMGPGDLRGQCGLVSVYEFLVYFSPSCPPITASTYNVAVIH